MREGIRSLRDNLAGAFQVMMGRPEGLNLLDTTLDGFWHSFAAIVLIVPFAILAFLGRGVTDQPLTPAELVLYGIALVVDWLAFPLLFALIASSFGLGSRYVPFIVARNWASVVITAMVSVVQALYLLGILPTEALPYAVIAATAVSFRFIYVVTRTTLLVSMSLALPIVIVDFLLSETIWTAFGRLG